MELAPQCVHPVHPRPAALMRVKGRLSPPDNSSPLWNSPGRLVKLSLADKTPSKRSMCTLFLVFFSHYEEKKTESGSSSFTFCFGDMCFIKLLIKTLQCVVSVSAVISDVSDLAFHRRGPS